MYHRESAAFSSMKHPLVLLLCIYLAANLLTLGYWHRNGWHDPTGDEVHFLVMSSGIVRHGTLEQTIPYKEDFQKHEIYRGWLPSDANPSPKNGHTFLGPHGLFSTHSIGLPLLLALPFAVAGVGGAKVFLVLLSGLVVVVVWKLSALFCADRRVRFWSTLAVTVALPLLAASNQVFTEIPAGLLCLVGLYWAMTAGKRRPLLVETALSLAIASLPWLQMKFILPMGVLLLGVGFKMLREGQSRARIAILAAACIASVVLLLAYNMYAFGELSVPLLGEFRPGETAIMVLCGLFLDQDHGFLLQNPVLFVGVFSIGMLFAFDVADALIWTSLFLSALVPNGLWDFWYGAWSFVGRYEWTAALIFFVPTILGLTRLGTASPRAFGTVVAAGALFQLHAYIDYTFRNALLINKWGVAVPWPLPAPADYSPFYGRLESWLPVFGNVQWAFRYPPNYLFLVLTMLLFLLGIRAALRPRRYASSLASSSIRG